MNTHEGPIYFQRKGYEEYRFLSNAWFSPFSVFGTHFATVEHFYQCCKATTEKDYQFVIAAPTPQEARLRGQQIKLPPLWGDPNYRINCMRLGLTHKFQQNPQLLIKLIQTRGRMLIEYAPYGDQFWGVDAKGIGENYLGRSLMMLRVLFPDPPVKGYVA